MTLARAVAPPHLDAADRARSTRVLARIGAGTALLGAAVVGALHFVAPTSQISPLRRTISEYALTSLAWAFNLGVILLTVGSVAVFVALAMARRLSVSGAVFAALWAFGLTTLVAFPKYNWSLGGQSVSGQVHRMASLVAFLALPVAALIVAGAKRARRHRTSRVTLGLAVLSLLWFSPILVAIATVQRAWWTAIPLGLLERGMALTEVLAVVALAGVATVGSRQAR